jgi:DNA-binding NtrC family response regulator
MLDYDWPGNIRELKAVIERAALMAEDNIITVEDLTFVSA